MVSRVLRDFGASDYRRGEIVGFNDEAHHCYQDRPVQEVDAGCAAKLSEEQEEANREARVWFKGLQAVTKHVGVKAVYDPVCHTVLPQGVGLERGLHLPVDGQRLLPHGRNRVRHRQDPPDPGRRRRHRRPRHLPAPGSFDHWRKHLAPHGEPPPVFIVVCLNTVVSKIVHDWIAGSTKTNGDGTTTPRPGNLPLFDNIEDGALLARPRTVLIDSVQLESGEPLSKDFKEAAAAEIDVFKSEYRRRNPGADVDKLTDEDLLREVMNTVGKSGRLGADVRCVVSVAMLTEGWDANAVTHILGIRAFGSQLLCEQVVGRGLRRRSYAVNEHGRLEPEYAG